jgi:pimeloyl-ACP methyl ester carboxylesterase
VWVEQLRQFISSVVGAEEPVVLVGNSLGGFAILATAGQHPELVRWGLSTSPPNMQILP